MEKLEAVFIICIIAVNSIGILSFIHFNEAPLLTDASYNAFESFEFTKLIKRKGLIEGYLGNSNYFTMRGPILLLISSPFLILFGYSQAILIGTNLIFSNLTLLGTYMLGKELKNKIVGALSVIFLLATPTFIGYSRSYMTDFAVIPFILFSLYFLFKSDFLTNSLFSITSGLFAGLSFVTRPASLVFLAGPAFFYFLTNIKENSLGKNQILNLTKAILAGSLLILVLYFPILDSTFQKQRQKMAMNTGPEEFHLFGFKNLKYNLFSIFTHLEVFCTFLFILGFFMILFTRFRFKMTLFSSLAVPYIFFTFLVLQNKSWDFFITLVPFLAIIAGIGFSQIKNKRIFKIALFAFILVCSFQATAISVRQGDMDILLVDYGENHLFYKKVSSSGTTIPKEKVFEGFLSEINLSKERITILSCPDSGDLFMVIGNYLYQEGIEGVNVEEKNFKEVRIEGYDYIIYRNTSDCDVTRLNETEAELLHKEDGVYLYEINP